MFSLAIYDTLTPGSLTGGADIAGTGTITPTARPDRSAASSRRSPPPAAPAPSLFMVPADNCADIGGLDPGDMRLVKATTMHGAVEAITDWADDHDAALPTCEDPS